MEGLCALGSGGLAQEGVLVLIQIVHVEFALLSLGGDGGEHGRRVGSPLDVTNLVSKIKGNNRSLAVHRPHFNGPVSRATEESLGMVSVPFNRVDSEVMVLVGFQVLATVGLGAQMNLAFFGTDEEQVVHVLVEVEAHTASEAVQELFLLIVHQLLALVNRKLKLDDLLSLELVLHQVPVGDTAIRRDGVEREVLGRVVSLPAHLPHRVGMLSSSHRRLVDWLVVGLESDIEDHHGTIVATDGDEGGAVGVEVNAHYAGLGREGVLGPGGVLDGEAADQTGGLLKEIVGTVGDGEQILVAGVPAHGGDVLPAGLLSGETPEREHGAVVVLTGVLSGVLVVLVILKLLVFGVLDDHSLHDLEAFLHARGVEGVLEVHLLHGGGLLILALGLGSLFGLDALVLLEISHESIEDHPLGSLNGVDRSFRRGGLHALLAERQVVGLGRALLVEELVTQRLLLGDLIVLDYKGSKKRKS